MNPHRFEEAEIAGLWRAIRERRDMRHFRPGPVPEAVMGRILEAAHLAPSVGFMQPWRFLRITDPALRHQIGEIVEAERQATAAALPSRQQEFMSLKVEGLRHCAELLAVVMPHGREQHIIGRRTMPDMDMASVGCAIQNMWLAARAEGIGLGWVSFFDPGALAVLLRLPPGAQPVALLCIGQVDAFYPRPMFEQTGWGQRLPQAQVVFENTWPEDAAPTPAAY